MDRYTITYEVSRVILLSSEAKMRASERKILEMGKLKSPALPSVEDLDSKSIKPVCKSVAKWLRRANRQEQMLVLEAMQLEVKAPSSRHAC